MSKRKPFTYVILSDEPGRLVSIGGDFPGYLELTTLPSIRVRRITHLGATVAEFYFVNRRAMLRSRRLGSNIDIFRPNEQGEPSLLFNLITTADDAAKALSRHRKDWFSCRPLRLEGDQPKEAT